MKTNQIISSIIACMLISGNISHAQTPHYYYYKGEKQYLNIDKSRVFVSVADTTQLNLATDVKKSEFKRDMPSDKPVKKDYTKRYWQELTLQDSLSESQYQNKIALIKQNNSNAIVSPYFTNQSGDTIGLSNFLYVQLKTLNDTIILKQQANNHNAIVVCQDKFMPLWFIVSITPASSYNAMELANIWHESGLFQSTESDFMIDNLLTCVNDTYFNNQWGLKNTGQYGGTSGIDIKACEAWQLSTGNDIVVTVLDHGIDLTHPDLVANIYPQSYDTDNATSPSVIRGNHGTACAGIVGAVRNNNAGIAGVAPNCKLMSISNSLSFNSSTVTLAKQQLADGINWARRHNADVISNSWGHNDFQGTYITEAIDSAVIRGRNGKGCVVVFASGNDNASTVSYPANLPNVIAVGAIDRNGQRANFSNHGTALDIVAPGVDIYTTDIQGNAGYNTSSGTNGNYYASFSGTSAACPHVAGVVALILSVRPDLIPAQVRQAIESTCTKISSALYSYANNANHPNGTWNNQVGHGLVNAYAAVNAVALKITGPSTFNATGTFQIQNRPASGTVSLQTSPGLSASISGNTITVNSNYPGEGWLRATVATASGTITSNTVYFIHGEYIPPVDIIGGVMCDNGCYVECGIETNKWTTNISYSTINLFRFGFSSPNYRSIANNLTYRARIVRQSDNVVVHNLPNAFEPDCDVLVEYTGLVSSVFYRLEIRCVTYNPNSQWQDVGEIQAVYRAIASPYVLLLSPNPASSQLNIEIETPQPANANAAPIQQASSTGNAPSTALPPQPVYEVKIFNTATGAMVYQQTMTGKSKQIDVSGLPNGIYTLSVSDGSGNPPMTQQIVVAH